MLPNPPPGHKHTLRHTVSFQLSLGSPSTLIPVLDSGNGTGTKVILHLPLPPLAFHLPPPVLLPPNSLKRTYLVPNTRTGKTRPHQPPEHRREWLQSADPRRLIPSPIRLWGPVQHQTARSARLTPADEGLGASLKEDGPFGSRWNMERRNAVCSAAPFHCQQLHSGNIYMYTHQDDPRHMFLYMKPCVGNLSAWVSALKKSNRRWE